MSSQTITFSSTQNLHNRTILFALDESSHSVAGLNWVFDDILVSEKDADNLVVIVVVDKEGEVEQVMSHFVLCARRRAERVMDWLPPGRALPSEARERSESWISCPPVVRLRARRASHGVAAPGRFDPAGSGSSVVHFNSIWLKCGCIRFQCGSIHCVLAGVWLCLA